MPILNPLPPWPNPQESIGRQILSSRVGSRKVWYSQGPAHETFEKVIQPEIENNLKQLDLGHAEMFIRLYMIGRNSENANPIIMICCTNKAARDAAETTIRESRLLEEHRGFGLGAATLPLEHPTPVRRLSPGSHSHSFSAGSSRSDGAIAPSQQMFSFPTNLTSSLPSDPMRYPPVDFSTPDQSSPLIVNALATPAGSGIPNTSTVVFASSADPRLGRRIFSPTSDGQVSHHYATAGIVIKVGESYYQLTAGHLFEGDSETLDVTPSLASLDECHFDGQSSNEEHDSDHELEITGRGSRTPEDAQSRNGSSSGSTNEDISDTCNANISPDRHHKPNKLNTQWDNVFSPHKPQEPAGTSSLIRSTPLNRRFPIGHLPQGKPIQPSIDYAMIALLSDSVKSMDKNVNTSQSPYPPVKDVAEVGDEECSIIVVTNSTIIRGTLIPGKVAYRGSRAHRFEGLVQIVLELELFEGDCGSPVLDKLTGSFYGHIVMGVAGTTIAYIVQALDIFQDILNRTSKSVRIVTREDSKETKPPSTRSLFSALPIPSNSRDRQSSFSREGSHYNDESSIFSRSCATSASSIVTKRDTKETTPLLAESGSQTSRYPPRFQGGQGSSRSSLHNTGWSAASRSLAALPCEFIGYSSCDQIFAMDDVENWIEHIITVHLEYKLPKRCICWFCDDIIFDYKRTGDRRENFYDRMCHIRDHFLYDGKTIHDIQPDHHLNTHLNHHGLISHQSYHSVRRYLKAPQPSYILPHDAEPSDWSTGDPHSVRRYTEAQPSYILSHDAVPSDWPTRDPHRGLEYSSPHDEERSYQRHRH